MRMAPTSERRSASAYPLLVERVRSSGVGLVAEVICDALIDQISIPLSASAALAPFSMMTTSGNAAATLTSRGTRDCVDLKRYRRFPGRTGFDENYYWICGQKNALPKWGMAVPVISNYRFGS